MMHRGEGARHLCPDSSNPSGECSEHRSEAVFGPTNASLIPNHGCKLHNSCCIPDDESNLIGASYTLVHASQS